MYRRYRSIAFRPASEAIIKHANEISAQYARQGFSLTLRQLYYRFVAADLLPNTQQSYKRLGSIINDARYAGLFDWARITDRTRNATGGDFGYDAPVEVIEPLSFSVTQWDDQKTRVEVWVEKDALVDVVQKAANPFNVTSFSCRGYTSSSEIWAAAQRIEKYLDLPEVGNVVILHLGDHDPSGIDMTRDITDRLEEFVRGDYFDPSRLEVRRIALTMAQIQQYDPPPNPAKETDSRFAGYSDLYGDESWELDALEPRVLSDLIRSNIRPLIDTEKWNARRAITAHGVATLEAVRDNYDRIIEWLDDQGLLPEPMVTADDDEEI